MFMPSWPDYQWIAIILGTILRVIDCVYLELRGGNPVWLELEALQREQ